MTKAELRKAIRIQLAGLSAEARTAQSAAICQAVATSPEWKCARTIGLFSPLASEPDVDPLWSLLEEREACYPRVHGDRLVFVRVSARSQLMAAPRWDLLEPAHDEEQTVPPSQIDLLLVPGMAFTADGHRMGRGKGFYDRLLADPAFTAATFGVCFAEQLVETLPMEDHDRRVGRVLARAV